MDTIDVRIGKHLVNHVAFHPRDEEGSRGVYAAHPAGLEVYPVQQLKAIRLIDIILHERLVTLLMPGDIT